MSDDNLSRRVFEALATGGPLPPELSASPSAQNAVDEHANLVEVLNRAVPVDSDETWMQSVLDRVDEVERGATSPRSHRLRGWTVVLAAAAAVVLTLGIPRQTNRPLKAKADTFTVALVSRPGVVRGAADGFVPGDSVQVAVVPAPAWLAVYFNDQRIAASCGQHTACRRQGSTAFVEVVLDAPGRYTTIVVNGRGSIPLLTGALDADVATLSAAGFHVRVEQSFQTR